MPITPNFIERTLFLTLNQGPGPMLDMWSGPAFWGVHAALELNVFEHLAQAEKSASQLVEVLDADPKGIQILLNLMENLGYVRRQGNVYENTAMTQKWLLTTSDMNMTPYFRFWGAMMRDFMPLLSESIKSGKDVDLYTWIESQPEVSRYFQEGMIQIARYVGDDIASAIRVPSPTARILDVGGGHGEYTIALCKQHPQLSAVIFDSPQALATGQQSVEQVGLSSRIQFETGNFMVDDLPTGCDVALVFNIVHGLQPEDNIALFKKIHDVLNPGGQIVVVEQVHNISPLPLTNTISYILSMSFYHLIGGQVYTAAEIQDWLQQAGFANQQRKNILKASSVLITAAA